jgi:transposase InsO family protein
MVNSLTIKDSYPLPRIDDSLDSLRGTSGERWFSTMDLASGYWQVGMDPADAEKTAFVTHEGLFQFKVMPFGLCNAPATFERLMESVLAGLHWKICLVYLDDIITFSDSFSGHLTNLAAILERLHSAGLKLHPGKCSFFRHEVKYLGHVVTKHGISTDPDKTAAIQKWPQPRNVHEVRCFLGTCSYYRRFIRNFADLARPLHQLTRKDVPFIWTEECTAAFGSLKTALQSPPVLAYPTREGEYILDTDASAFAISGVLSQMQDGEEHVISYFSQGLTKEERRYCVTRRELLAVVKSVKHFHSYLYGICFTVRTDHSSLQWLLRFKNPEDQLARWFEMLGTYNFTIQFRPGRLHGNADGLSRIPCGPCTSCERKEDKDRAGYLRAMHQPLPPRQSAQPPGPTPSSTWIQGISMAELQEAQGKDSDLAELVALKVHNQPRPQRDEVLAKSSEYKHYWQQWERLVVNNGILFREWHEGSQVHLQFIVPRSLKPLVLQGLHDALTAGHLGTRRTLLRVRAKYYWSGYQQDVRDWCRRCTPCQARRRSTKAAQAPLKTSKVGERFQRVAMDILGPLPRTDAGNLYVLIISDYFSKWCVAVPMMDMEAITVARAFVDHFVTIFGVPRQLHTDQGSQFESKLFQAVCKLLGIDKTRTTPYWPQSDGLVERCNATLEAMLSKVVSSHQKDWDVFLQPLMMAYRSSAHDTTGYSPNMLMFGEELTLPIHLLVGPPSAEATEPNLPKFAFELRETLAEVHHTARDQGRQMQATQKKHYDATLQLNKYQVGDQVWLKQTRRFKGLSPKLSARWVGPYHVTRVISDWLYRLRKGNGKEQVVHHNRLKKHEGQNVLPPSAQPLEEDRTTPTALPTPEESEGETEDYIAADPPAPTITRGGRVSRRPTHLLDYV